MGEAELIKQCMRGVNAARKELYDTYAEQMLSICSVSYTHLTLPTICSV